MSLKWHFLREKGLTSPDDILREFGIVTAPIPVMELTKELGIDLVFVPSDTYKSALNPKISKIVINSNNSLYEQRFAVAHEIGHLMLHSLDKIYRDQSFDNDTLEEIQANKFAKDLLTPIWLVNTYRNQLNISNEQLSKIFQINLEIK